MAVAHQSSIPKYVWFLDKNFIASDTLEDYTPVSLKIVPYYLNSHISRAFTWLRHSDTLWAWGFGEGKGIVFLIKDVRIAVHFKLIFG